MRVDLFDFDLPQDLIAQRPVSPRDAARLLDVAPMSEGGGLHDRGVRDLPGLLRRGDLMVFNDTKVIPARLLGTRPAGGKVEALLIRDLGQGRWLSFARPTKRMKLGDSLTFAAGLGATVAAKHEDGSIVLAFNATGPAFHAALEVGGARVLVADLGDEKDFRARHAGRADAPHGEQGQLLAPRRGLLPRPPARREEGADGRAGRRRRSGDPPGRIRHSREAPRSAG